MRGVTSISWSTDLREAAGPSHRDPGERLSQETSVSTVATIAEHQGFFLIPGESDTTSRIRKCRPTGLMARATLCSRKSQYRHAERGKAKLHQGFDWTRSTQDGHPTGLHRSSPLCEVEGGHGETKRCETLSQGQSIDVLATATTVLLRQCRRCVDRSERCSMHYTAVSPRATLCAT